MSRIFSHTSRTTIFARARRGITATARNTSLQRRLRVYGLCNVDMFLTCDLYTELAVALTWLQHDVEESRSYVAYLK
jgi:hypothetical protein